MRDMKEIKDEAEAEADMLIDSDASRSDQHDRRHAQPAQSPDLSASTLGKEYSIKKLSKAHEH